MMVTTQQAAGFKAARTRKFKKLDKLVAEGKMKITVAAGHKAAATRRLQKQLS